MAAANNCSYSDSNKNTSPKHSSNNNFSSNNNINNINTNNNNLLINSTNNNKLDLINNNNNQIGQPTTSFSQNNIIINNNQQIPSNQINNNNNNWQNHNQNFKIDSSNSSSNKNNLQNKKSKKIIPNLNELNNYNQIADTTTTINTTSTNGSPSKFSFSNNSSTSSSNSSSNSSGTNLTDIRNSKIMMMTSNTYENNGNNTTNLSKIDSNKDKTNTLLLLEKENNYFFNVVDDTNQNRQKRKEIINQNELNNLNATTTTTSTAHSTRLSHYDNLDKPTILTATAAATATAVAEMADIANKINESENMKYNKLKKNDKSNKLIKTTTNNLTNNFNNNYNISNNKVFGMNDNENDDENDDEDDDDDVEGEDDEDDDPNDDDDDDNENDEDADYEDCLNNETYSITSKLNEPSSSSSSLNKTQIDTNLIDTNRQTNIRNFEFKTSPNSLDTKLRSETTSSPTTPTPSTTAIAGTLTGASSSASASSSNRFKLSTTATTLTTTTCKTTTTTTTTTTTSTSSPSASNSSPSTALASAAVASAILTSVKSKASNLNNNNNNNNNKNNNNNNFGSNSEIINNNNNQLISNQPQPQQQLTKSKPLLSSSSSSSPKQTIDSPLSYIANLKSANFSSSSSPSPSSLFNNNNNNNNNNKDNESSSSSSAATTTKSKFNFPSSRTLSQFIESNEINEMKNQTKLDKLNKQHTNNVNDLVASTSYWADSRSASASGTIDEDNFNLSYNSKCFNFDDDLATSSNNNSNQTNDTYNNSSNNNNSSNSKLNIPDSLNSSKNEKLKQKRSAFAWVGRTVGRRNYLNTHNRRHQSPNSSNIQSQHNRNTTTMMNVIKKSNKIDWSENAKQGVHLWIDVHNTQSNDSCYLSESDALQFHKINNSLRCAYSSRNEPKKKCSVCKVVVHDSCIETLQQHVKCRVTFREATNKKKVFVIKTTTQSASNSSTSVNLHHWICRKYDENNFENKCQACLKSYTNRFGLQTNRTIVSCSWCKAAYHLKCFSSNQLKLECNFGEHNQLIVPPSWVVKLATKNSLRANHILKPYHRTSKRNHQDQSALNNSNNPNSSSSLSSNNNNNNNTHLIPDSNSNLLLTANSNNSNTNSNNLHHQHSIRHSNRSFIIRPPSTVTSQNLSLIKPLLVLINPKSGGKLGPKILKKFTWLLNARQVFDLTHPGCPKFPLHLYRNVPNLRLLVGGGDGTIGWVLSVIDQINFLVSPPSVAVLPLGTGNDLARALNWGGGYTDEPLSKILSKILESRSVKLDRWKITTKPNPYVDLDSLENGENAIDKLKNDVMNNYFSLGADAHVCLEFHERREANPEKFTSRWFNRLQYVEAGSKDMIKKTWRDLKDYIQLECDNKSYTELIRSRGYHFIIFLNIPKYSSGTNPWGNSNDINYQPQAINDGRIEVVGCFTSTLAKVLLGGSGERICQAKYIKLITSTYIPIQIDGEPAKLAPSIIEIKHKNQAMMLEHVKYNTDSPILGYSSNIQKNFEVKCVLFDDFEKYRKDTQTIEKKAIYIGTICTSNLLDNLSKVRITINILIKNCANGFYTSKWSFLSADEFYRISDDADECLLDIVSTDEIVYILDESLSNNLEVPNNNIKEENLVEETKNLNDEITTKQIDNKNQQNQNQIEKNHIPIQKSIEFSNETFTQKIPSSQSSPKISTSQTSIVQGKGMTSSKSTQFISLANLNKPSNQFI